MITRVIAWSAKNRLATLLLVALASAWGVLSLRHTALDAIPDLSDVQVIIFSEWMGRAPDLVEDKGHLYGTRLKDEEKKALIAFLKSL